MEAIINKNKLSMTLLKNIDIGTQGYFEFSAGIGRFGLMKSLTSILVTPIMHRNMSKFMGIDAQDKYICYKVIKDKFIALTYTGELQTWNVLTAKPLGKHKLNISFEDYDLQSKFKNGAVLIRSKEAL